ncbi:MAG TPA: ASKHA domain-containing protein [Anaerolineales bacterium]|nr:ASKHA domain-containing protein [Anaerolineales bacterium]
MAYTIEFEPIGIRLICDDPLTISEAARQAGVSIRSVCGGKASCGKCLVRVMEGHLDSPTEAEQKHLTLAQISAGWRLACRTIIATDTHVYIPANSLTESQVIQIEGAETAAVPDPAVRLLPLLANPPSLSDQIADLERVANALRQQHALESVWAGLPALCALRSVLRETDWQIEVALRGTEIIAAYPLGQHRPVGMAVDVGTTKLACYLVDLETGRTLAAKGVMNPQIAYGEDVMSRLEAVLVEPGNADRLQAEVVSSINDVAKELCAAQSLTPDHILDYCLVGNTAMHHLLAKLPVRPLAVSPFIPTLSDVLDIEADRLGLNAAPGARAYLPAPLAGFVGSDHLAFLLASGFDEGDRIRLGIDIGTNTEIALQVGRRIITCSTASGPAFEGAHIHHGMRAAPGAIERVKITEEGGIQCDVIGGVPAVGICGSGILDALAEMYRARIINERGRFQLNAPGVEMANDDSLIFSLSKGVNGYRDVTLSQHDVDQVMLAKGAIRAGIEILLSKADVAPADIEEIVIAGAFGTYLDPCNAVRIGLIPGVPVERIRAVGNAAGAGARLLLSSLEYRRRAHALAKRIEYVELTIVPGFNKFFAKGVRFPTPA